MKQKEINKEIDIVRKRNEEKMKDIKQFERI